MENAKVRRGVAVVAGLVVLAACSGGGAGGPISMTIAPSSPSVTAGGAPVTLTATLTNASGTITWTLVGAGSLSSTTGMTVAYTPPASATDPTTATVRASGGGVTAEVTISIAPGGVAPSITITGPGTVQAGGAAVAYAATVTGGTGTIAWSLSGPGTLSSTSGATTSYTPPAAVASATTATLIASGAGATSSLTITVTPASPPPITITVTGPTSVVAGGAPVTYTATLSSGSATVTWTLTGPGSLSPTTGSETSYTPPPTTDQGASLTLTASATGATPGTLAITLAAPATITVSGIVVIPSQLPAEGMTVVIPGRPATITDASGTFSISGVTTPYDCTVLVTPTDLSITYVGLTRPDPTLQVFDLIEPRSGTLDGAVTPFSATAMAPRLVFGSPDGAAEAVDGAPAGDPVPDRYDYQLFPGWSGPPITTGTVHALQWLETDGLPTTYTGYGSQANVAVPNYDVGTATAPTVTLAPVETSTLTGSITAFEGAVLLKKEVDVHFDTGGLLPIVVDGSAPLAFSYATPSLASVATLDVTVTAALGTGDDVSHVCERGLAADADVQLALVAPPLASAPGSGATGVGLTTDFTWSGFSGGVHVLVTQADGAAPWYYVVTSGTAARIPDLSAHGMPLPPSTDYRWQVRAYARFPDVDAFAGPGEPLRRSQHYGTSAFRPFRTQ